MQQSAGKGTLGNSTALTFGEFLSMSAKGVSPGSKSLSRGVALMAGVPHVPVNFVE